MTEKSTQCQRIINYMVENESITQIEALNVLGVMRLASRISDLKKQGFHINDEFVKTKNRYGEAISYKKYSLDKDKDNDAKC